jgi:hypothetical protein
MKTLSASVLFVLLIPFILSCDKTQQGVADAGAGVKELPRSIENSSNALKEGVTSLGENLVKSADAIDPIAIKLIFQKLIDTQDKVAGLEVANAELKNLIVDSHRKQYPYFIDVFMEAHKPNKVEIYLLSQDGKKQYVIMDQGHRENYRYFIPAYAILQYDGKIYFNIDLSGETNIVGAVQARIYKTLDEFPGAAPPKTVDDKENLPKAALLSNLVWATAQADRGYGYIATGEAKREFMIWSPKESETTE